MYILLEKIIKLPKKKKKIYLNILTKLQYLTNLLQT